MSASQPLTGDELATIRARAEAIPRDGSRLTPDQLDTLPTVQCQCGRRMHIGVSDETLRLVAEIERLQALMPGPNTSRHIRCDQCGALPGECVDDVGIDIGSCYRPRT